MPREVMWSNVLGPQQEDKRMVRRLAKFDALLAAPGTSLHCCCSSATLCSTGAVFGSKPLYSKGPARAPEAAFPILGQGRVTNADVHVIFHQHPQDPKMALLVTILAAVAVMGSASACVSGPESESELCGTFPFSLRVCSGVVLRSLWMRR